MNKVDTLSFGILFNKCENRENIAQIIKYKTKYNETSCAYFGKCKQYSFYYKAELYCLIITLKHSAVENKTDEEIELNARNIVNEYFKIDLQQLKIVNLNRIDYKNDNRLNNKQEKAIIKQLTEKAVMKIGKNYKKKIDNKDGFYKAKYTSDGSGYVEIIIYDKEEEMFIRKLRGEATNEEAEKYKDTIRVEVRIKNGRLNYEKSKYGVSKNISNYFEEAVAKTYFDYYITKIFGTEKFYRIDKALEKVNNNKELKNSMKAKLSDLLKNVNENGYTKAKEFYTESTFKNYIKRLNELKINVLTFNEEINGNKIKVKSMVNFGLMKG